LPESPDYDEARKLFDGMIDCRPAIIAQCAGVADVRRAIAYGRASRLEIAVRGGGHGVAGRALCEGGLAGSSFVISVTNEDGSSRRRGDALRGRVPQAVGVLGEIRGAAGSRKTPEEAAASCGARRAGGAGALNRRLSRYG
jgi:FAD/FMN-containing dehydrogenase